MSGVIKRLARRAPRALWFALASAGLVAGDPASSASFGFTSQADWNTGTYASTHTGPPPAGANGEVRLDQAILSRFSHIWVALSGRDGVVRINTNINPATIGNGDSFLSVLEAGGTAVLGEYLTRPNGMAGNPSRTTVDANGDVWVGNRNESSGGLGSITKISANPTGPSSTGVWNSVTGTFDRFAWTNAGNVDSGGGVSTAADSALLQYVRTTGANVRHMSIDKNNNVWAGGGPLDSNDQVFQLYNGTTGAAIPSSPGNTTTFGELGGPAGGNVIYDRGGYGGLVDGKGVVWSTGLNGNTTVRFDPATGTASAVNSDGRYMYGMGIDSGGNVWISNWEHNSIQKFDSNGNFLTTYGAGTCSGCRGVAVTPDDDIWVAGSHSNTVTRYNNDGSVQATIAVGAHPTGVAVDNNGKVWVTNFNGNSVMRINPTTNAVELTIDLGPGANPYNYSDMTGTVLSGTTNPSGSWRKKLYGGINPDWQQIFWNEEAEGAIPLDTTLMIEVRGADSEAGLESATYVTMASAADLSMFDGMDWLDVRARFARPGGVSDSPVLSDLRITFTPGDTPIPEPGTLGLLAVALLALVGVHRRSR